MLSDLHRLIRVLAYIGGAAIVVFISVVIANYYDKQHDKTELANKTSAIASVKARLDSTNRLLLATKVNQETALRHDSIVMAGQQAMLAAAHYIVHSTDAFHAEERAQWKNLLNREINYDSVKLKAEKKVYQIVPRWREK